jgi:hypothetical protein
MSRNDEMVWELEFLCLVRRDILFVGLTALLVLMTFYVNFDFFSIFYMFFSLQLLIIYCEFEIRKQFID